MRAKRKFIAAGWLALIGIAALLARSAWVARHDPSRQVLSVLASQCETVIQKIEEFKLANGRLPVSLNEIGFVDGPWRYDADEYGTAFELYQPHSHWVSSFNAFLYASDGTPRSRWEGLRVIECGRYRYLVGAQHVKANW